MRFQKEKFSEEDAEKTINDTIDAIHEFREDKTFENAVHADLLISIMRLTVGNDNFDNLNYFLAAEREVKEVVDENMSKEKYNVQKKKH